jgi:hypothetical protein
VILFANAPNQDTYAYTLRNELYRVALRFYTQNTLQFFHDDPTTLYVVRTWACLVALISSLDLHGSADQLTVPRQAVGVLKRRMDTTPQQVLSYLANEWTWL